MAADWLPGGDGRQRASGSLSRPVPKCYCVASCPGVTVMVQDDTQVPLRCVCRPRYSVKIPPLGVVFVRCVEVAVSLLYVDSYGFFLFGWVASVYKVDLWPLFKPAAEYRPVILVQLGQADIKCPITECSEHLDETTVLCNLPHDDIIKYKYFLELSRIDSSTKPCPQCKHFTTFRRRGHIPTPAKLENKYKIQCPSCQFVWCFKCHSPWHEGVNCKEYKKGDKLLRHWANEIEHGQRNAQKCPKCKIHIQRTEGCDHMTCSQCNTNFCYRCGERYRQLRFFGDHTSNLSIFGCKYRYLPERPHLRRLVRGSVC
ncbi:PREDICTED: probable E3 ubiquitin-protein ligase RNF217, partial [Cariama cristata]|uniref:probable E3 ubiquitin-protein ligase RNF217 n=1 Tax=Cariama cristata TaxID=54380 RepID=UPI0005208664